MKPVILQVPTVTDEPEKSSTGVTERVVAADDCVGADGEDSKPVKLEAVEKDVIDTNYYLSLTVDTNIFAGGFFFAIIFRIVGMNQI